MIVAIAVGIVCLIAAAIFVYVKTSRRSDTQFKLEPPPGPRVLRGSKASVAPAQKVDRAQAAPPSPDARIVEGLYRKLFRLEVTSDEFEVRRKVAAARVKYSHLSERELLEKVLIETFQLKLINRFSGNRAAMMRIFENEKSKHPNMSELDLWEEIYYHRDQARGR